MTIYIAVVYSILYLTFYAFPYAFTEERGWSRTIGSLSFLSMFTGIITACGSVALYSFKYYQPRLKRRGHVMPEDRLPPIMIGSFLLPIGLFVSLCFLLTSSANHFSGSHGHRHVRSLGFLRFSRDSSLALALCSSSPTVFNSLSIFTCPHPRPPWLPTLSSGVL